MGTLRLVVTQYFVVLQPAHQNQFLASHKIESDDTHVDENLAATECQMSGRKMLPNLGGMHAAAVLYACDVKRGTVRVSPAFHGSRLEFLKIELIAVLDPSYRAGIADENFEFAELHFKI
jgi:hypothetical protein